MTPFRAAMGVVDRLQGLPLPQNITLYATLISKKLNHDGHGFESSDVVSEAPVPIQFGWNRQELRNSARVRIHLLKGSWRDLYILLQDEHGEPFGKGAVALGGAAAHYIDAAPDMITVTTRLPSKCGSGELSATS